MRLIALYVSIPFQLTHSKWSVTYPLKEFPLSYMFQLIHSKWSVTSRLYSVPKGMLFQLTHSKWSVTFLVTAIICLILVSTHTLQVECDIGKIGSEYGGYVSTHTLQVECDWNCNISRNIIFGCFNSHTPSGV